MAKILDVRVDSDGDLRCWNCGGKSFTEKRTGTAKVVVGFGALLTRKKLRCHTCGAYNRSGNAKPWTGPRGRKYKKAAERLAEAARAATPEVELVTRNGPPPREG